MSDPTEDAPTEPSPEAEAPPKADAPVEAEPAAPQPTAPLEGFTVHKGDPKAADTGSTLWLLFIALPVLLVGAGMWMFGEPSDDSPKPPTPIPNAPVAPTAPPPSKEQVWTHAEHGVRVTIPAGVRAQRLRQGAMLNMAVAVGDSPGVSMVFGPRYPWMKLAGVNEQLGGEWHDGADISRPDAPIAFTYATAEHWATVEEPNPGLIILTPAHLVVIHFASPEAMQSAELQAVVNGLVALPVTSARDIFKKRWKLDDAVASQNPSDVLNKELGGYVAELRPRQGDLPFYLRMGMDAFQKGALDHLEARLLREVLLPIARQSKAQRRRARKPKSGDPLLWWRSDFSTPEPTGPPGPWRP